LVAEFVIEVGVLRRGRPGVVIAGDFGGVEIGDVQHSLRLSEWHRGKEVREAIRLLRAGGADAVAHLFRARPRRKIGQIRLAIAGVDPSFGI